MRRRSGLGGGAAIAALMCGCASGADMPDGAGGSGGSVSESTTATSSGTNQTTGNQTSQAASGTGGTSSCVYPSTGYGVHVGETVDPSLSWQGYGPSSDVAGAVSPPDFFDCDGSKGIHAVLFVLSATWCEPCQAEATTLEGKAAQWSSMGIRVVTLMVQDATENPAALATATQWKTQFGLSNVGVVADPGFSFDQFDFATHTDHTGFPTQIIVDPRTMKIVTYQQGDAPVDSQLEALAESNAP